MKKFVKFLFTAFFVLLHHISLSQQGKLDFNFTYAIQQGKMTSLNAYLHDSNFDKTILFKKNSYLKSINKFYGQINYQFWKNLNVGLFACFQNSGVVVNHMFSVFDPIDNTTVDYSYNYELMVRNSSIGVSTSILYDEIFNFRNKNPFLHRFLVKNVFNWGVAQSTLRSSQVGVFPVKYELNEYDFKAIHLTGDISLNVNYEFLRKPILSSFGVCFGYQFNESGVLQNLVGQTLRKSDNTSINLDFSGFYFGLNLLLGK